ncbi:MAG: hypothetical protein NT150_00860 [Bacteroidetes bacterium]|nr:hypothetical protein [Bacteroidota bacterium]
MEKFKIIGVAFCLMIVACKAQNELPYSFKGTTRDFAKRMGLASDSILKTDTLFNYDANGDFTVNAGFILPDHRTAFYYQSGNLFMKYNYHDVYHYNDLYEEYYDELKKLKEIGWYEKGQKVGVCKYYSASGDLVATKSWEKGKLIKTE